MKPILTFALALLPQLALHAEPLDPSGGGQAQILGTIADGTLPPPPEPGPKLEIPASAVLKAEVHEVGGRHVTLQEVAPVELPPLADTIAAGPADEETLAALRERAAERPAVQLIFASATVYLTDTGPRTLVRFWPKDNVGMVVLWSSADWSLLSGVGSFADAAGNTYSLVLGHGTVDPVKMAAAAAARGKAYQSPTIPELPPGSVTYRVAEGNPALEALAPITALHEIFQAREAELRAAYEARKQAQATHEADLAANPPQPQDLLIRYWRAETPASANVEGGEP